MVIKKSQRAGSVEQRRLLIKVTAQTPPRKRQCELLGVPRSSTYYKPRPKKDESQLKNSVKEWFEKDPCLGVRRLSGLLKQAGMKVGRKKIVRLKKELGLRTIYRHPRTTVFGKKREESKYPYLLNDKEIAKTDEVWTSDITYLQIGRKNYYLCVVMDWASRSVLGWSLGGKMTTSLCVEALWMAFRSGRKPKIFNTDQGSQYTSKEWQEILKEEGVEISQDGKGRWSDNVIMERFWRTYKHEFFLLRDPLSLEVARKETAVWLDYYNRERPHTSLGDMSPMAYAETQGIPPATPFLSDFSTSRRCPSLRSGKTPLRSKIAQKRN